MTIPRIGNSGHLPMENGLLKGLCTIGSRRRKRITETFIKIKTIIVVNEAMLANSSTFAKNNMQVAQKKKPRQPSKEFVDALKF